MNNRQTGRETGKQTDICIDSVVLGHNIHPDSPQSESYLNLWSRRPQTCPLGGKMKFEWSGVRASDSRRASSIHPDMSAWQPSKWVPHPVLTQEASGMSIEREKWSFNDLVLGHQILGGQPPFILICLLDSLQSESHTQFWLRRPQACP